MRRLSWNDVEFLDICSLRHLPGYSDSYWVKHFETNQKSTQTPLYDNEWLQQPYTNRNMRKKIYSSLSSNSQSVCLIQTFSKYRSSFAMQRSILSAYFTLIVFSNLARERLLKNMWTLLITSLFDVNQWSWRCFLKIKNNQSSGAKYRRK